MQHLNEEQICRCIAGDATTAESAHLAECHTCATSVQRTQLAFANFRAVAETCRPSGVPVTGTPRRRTLIPVWSAGFALVVFLIAYSFHARSRTQTASVLYDDAALLNQVSADVKRTAPYSLSPLLIPEPGAVRR